MLTIYLVLFLSGFYSVYLQANMLISPTRVALNDRERSAQVILINEGSDIQTYRVGWSEKRVLPNGKYQALDEKQSANFPTASGMFRFSPKQVTLVPGGRQIVKLGVRRPKGLANGEYRSHLTFTALPPETIIEAAEETSIRLNVMLSYSIPVILRQGPLNYNVAFNSVDVEQSMLQGQPEYVLQVRALRSGTSSTYGRIRAYWTPNNSSTEIIAGVINGVNFFPDTSEINKTIIWQSDSLPPSSGKLRLVYEGAKEFQGIVLAEKIVNL